MSAPHNTNGDRCSPAVLLMEADTGDPSRLYAHMSAELEAVAAERGLAVDLEPASLLAMVGLVQLGLRHPSVPPFAREIGSKFVEGARDWFHECPTVLAVIARGDDPGYPAWRATTPAERGETPIVPVDPEQAEYVRQVFERDDLGNLIPPDLGEVDRSEEQ